jgi:predicted nucleotidyltransferase
MKKGVPELLGWVADFLNHKEISWALVGGWAVSVRTEPRFTRDLDLTIAVGNDTQAEQLIGAFTSSQFKIEALVEQDAKNRLATVRLALPPVYESGLLLDLLFASSGIEIEVSRDADRIAVFPGTMIPVAKTPHLLALKILARDDQTRPQDAGDISALLKVMSNDEIDQARHLLDLITERGFHRGKNLHEELLRASA